MKAFMTFIPSTFAACYIAALSRFTSSAVHNGAHNHGLPDNGCLAIGGLGSVPGFQSHI